MTENLPPAQLTGDRAIDVMVAAAIDAGRDFAEQAHLKAEIARAAAPYGHSEAEAAKALQGTYDGMVAHLQDLAVQMREIGATERQADALVAGAQGMFFQRTAELSAWVGLTPGRA